MAEEIDDQFRQALLPSNEERIEREGEHQKDRDANGGGVQERQRVAGDNAESDVAPAAREERGRLHQIRPQPLVEGQRPGAETVHDGCAFKLC